MNQYVKTRDTQNVRIRSSAVARAAQSDLNGTDNHGKLSQTTTWQPQNYLKKKKKDFKVLASTDVGPA